MADLPDDKPKGGLSGVTIDFGRALPDVAPPLAAYAASMPGHPRAMAVGVDRSLPPRQRALNTLVGQTIAGLVTPLAHGPAALSSGSTGYFIVCQMPPGPSLAAGPRQWSEAELLELLIKPVAAVLAELQALTLTHRAIRPRNVFQATPGSPVALGCAWAAPPASHQPNWMEPPYAAMCMPAGRGDGTIADDVYALGALAVMLALGTDPVAGSDDATLLHRKLDVGSYAAIAGTHRLPATLAELLRGMLADDPEHRPPPHLLSNPAVARSRRVAARPVAKAARPMEIGKHQAWTLRTLAHALQQEPERAAALLRNGTVDRWLRRSLGDGVTANHVDEAARIRAGQAGADPVRADAMLLTRAIAVIDPLAPIVWRSVAVWPDGLGPALHYALRHHPSHAEELAEIVSMQVNRAWMERRGNARDPLAERLEALSAAAWIAAGRNEASALRLAYSLNPMAPCDSRCTERAWVTRLVDLLPAIKAYAAATPLPVDTLVDNHIPAFIAARRDERLDADLNRLSAAMSPSEPLSQLRLLARLQVKVSPEPAPGLCAWAGEILQPVLRRFRSRTRRTRMAEQLALLCRAGHMAPILALIDDRAEHRGDSDGMAAATARLRAIDTALDHLVAMAGQRSDQARRLGQDIACGLGLLACAIGLTIALLD